MSSLNQGPNMNNNISSHLMTDEDGTNNGERQSMPISRARILNAELDAIDAEIMGEENMESLRDNVQVAEDEYDYEETHNLDPDIPLNSQWSEDGNQSSTLQDRSPEQIIHVTASRRQHQMSSISGSNPLSINSEELQFQDEENQQTITQERGDEISRQSIQPNISARFNQQPIASNVPLTGTNLAGVSQLMPPFPPNPSINPLPPAANRPAPPQILSMDVTPTLISLEPSNAARSIEYPESDNDLAPVRVGNNNIPIENLMAFYTHQMINQANYDLYNTLRHWCEEASRLDPKYLKNIRSPSVSAVESLWFVTPEVVQRADLRGERYDYQGINWKALGVFRDDARDRRRKIYRNYNTIRYPETLNPRQNNQQLDNCENYFRFRRMDLKHVINITHFQLRNLIACPTRDHVFYANKSTVHHCTPTVGNKSAIPSIFMDLSNPSWPSQYSLTQGIQISTLTVGHNILIAGGLCGEYALINLRAEKGTKHIQGLITDHPNSITNNIQIHSTRSSASPVAAFASNQTSLRLLDVHTNTIISEHPFEHALNCSAISPDKRLRVIVGDTRHVLICDAENGELLQSLDGHNDFGFACDWADDGWTVATGNQDQKIKIWDARKWRDSHGVAYPVASIATEIAEVRKLKFSPIGSGKRVLVAAEPIDYLNIIDAERFASKQTISLFGEISGFDFTNDGQDLLVASSDNTRGGILEFERANLAAHGRYDLESAFQSKTRSSEESNSYDWMSDEDLVRHPKARATTESLERRPLSLGAEMGFF
ncbi:WD repeat-containing protein [Golovinomyces cichoracearum]|uniref:WD repeat-containing protein n=1 Tax=Golovinomyces cichoracearum TaxID=62708 RepID=A0A420IQ25_9PEZI|nr:WD repeat-containing protein [Golovinomyces cichoracearum]